MKTPTMRCYMEQAEQLAKLAEVKEAGMQELAFKARQLLLQDVPGTSKLRLIPQDTQRRWLTRSKKLAPGKSDLSRTLAAAYKDPNTKVMSYADLMKKKAGHPEDRLRERAPSLSPDTVQRVEAMAASQRLSPHRTYHARLPDGSSAVIAPVGKEGRTKHVVKTILARGMRPPGPPLMMAKAAVQQPVPQQSTAQRVMRAAPGAAAIAGGVWGAASPNAFNPGSMFKSLDRAGAHSVKGRIASGLLGAGLTGTTAALPSVLHDSYRALRPQQAKTASVQVGPPPSPNRTEYPYTGTIQFRDLPLILVENKKGSTRSGTGPKGKTWSTVMPAHYGEFKGTQGTDGDPVDVYVGDDMTSDMAYIVHTAKPPSFSRYDEDKVAIGYKSLSEVREMMEAAYDDKRFFKGLSACSIEDLKVLLRKKAARGKKLDQQLVLLKAAGLFDKNSPLNIRDKVEVLVHDGKGNMLAATKKGPSYAFPGGGLDGASASDAARKEVLEEVGYAINRPKRLGISPKTVLWNTPELQESLKRKGEHFDGSRLHFRTAQATGRDDSLYGTEGDVLQGAKFIPIKDVADNLRQYSQDPTNIYREFDEQKLRAVEKLQGQLERKEKIQAVAKALYPWDAPSFKDDSTPVLVGKAFRDAGIIAGSASAGYFGAGALDYGLRQTGAPAWWRTIPPEAQLKILRTAGGISGIGLAATYMATRAMHGKARYHERNPDQG